MLTTIDESELPGCGGKCKSERRAFAEETLREFAATAGAGGIAEVTGWPSLSAEPVENAQKMAGALREEAFRLRMRGEVSVMRRGARVFLKKGAAR